ncbi:hypothetical protein D0T25_31905 [Duganella sp. BJB488]|uniref:helix-turn-helix domain-containing protein n=2 Tax=Duganella TaxID=75654 RepID=UPI000E34F73F|nr:hypothetical protein D0T26_31760 [Duganella sp. BJB489]RFP10937.1 hypothetical protein D0T25_31905 [Duganella sp. BJB488]RFP27850.1 hypothetical protein D0T24_31825 [Duganella sp. BJB480]
MLQPRADVVPVAAGMPVGPLGPAVDLFEAGLIECAFREAGSSKPHAAAAVDISERTLWYKLKKLD